MCFLPRCAVFSILILMVSVDQLEILAGEMFFIRVERDGTCFIVLRVPINAFFKTQLECL